MKRFNTAVIAAIAVVSVSTAALALTRVWVSTSSTNFGTPGNWSAAFVPGSNDKAQIDSVTATVWPLLDTNRTISALDMRDGTSGSTVSFDLHGNALTVSNAFTVNDPSSASYVEILNSTGSGSLSCNTLTIAGGASANYSDVLKITSGTVSTSGLLKIQQGSYTTDQSCYGEMIVGASATVSPNSMEMDGAAKLDLNANMTVTGEFKVSAANSADPTITLAGSTTLTCGSFKILGNSNGVTVQPSFGTSSQIITN